MKIGLGLIEEGAGAISEVAETPALVPEEPTTEVEPISEEEPEVISQESWKEIYSTLEESKGLNRDIVLSIEQMCDGFLKDNGLRIGEFTDGLSMVGYNHVKEIVKGKIKE